MARRKTLKLVNPFKAPKKKKTGLSKLLNDIAKGHKEIQKYPYGRAGWW
jgi:hypothetical protein